ncbi:hypothetical protein [Cyanobium sp. Morenito 9A2]|uniref:hypothetical protein n=1 Tax=Cyanobium sp. Morenito 9A2 TaxID=2823718 RepID=UPI0020CD9793|nr:hypothetical protein [Cyanobium sp. Morenito 9A2]MCP9851085.1 hypothetical protein [Cyanobium sp. Morenito 9A2]
MAGPTRTPASPTSLGPSSLPVQLFWFVALLGEVPLRAMASAGRQITLPAIQQSARAAEGVSSPGLLLPAGRSCADTWVAASAWAAFTERLSFPLGARPGIGPGAGVPPPGWALQRWGCDRAEGPAPPPLSDRSWTEVSLLLVSTDGDGTNLVAEPILVLPPGPGHAWGL